MILYTDDDYEYYAQQAEREEDAEERRIESYFERDEW